MGRRMTAPRQILEGQFYLVTRRTWLRTFLLLPNPMVNRMFEYCLAEAAARFGIELIAWCAMSNHYHAVIYDRDRNVPAFIERFHKMLAKALNVHYGRFESIWSRDQTCLTRLVTLGDVFDKVVYVLSNPAAAHLVDNIVQWPGSSSWDRMGRGAKTIERPRQYFVEQGRMPAEVELGAVAPPGLVGESYAKWVDRVRGAVTDRQDDLAKKRRKDGRGIVGRKGIRATSHLDTPKTEAPRRKLRPHLACKDRKRMKEEQLALKGFRSKYKEARERLRDKSARFEFPVGTYRLRLLGLRCAGCSAPPQASRGAKGSTRAA